MTLKEFMEENYPDCVDEIVDGGVIECPSSYRCLEGHYNDEFCDACYDAPFFENCESCWNQPYIETTDTTELTEKEKENAKERTK